MMTPLLSGLVAAGVIVSGVLLWRIAGARRARWIVATLAAYGGVAFAHAMVTGITLRAALGGSGLFQALPHILQGTFIGAFVVLPLGWIASVVRAGIPRFREGSPRRNLYQAVALTTCVGLVLTSTPLGTKGDSRANSGSTDPQSRVADLNNGLSAIEDSERESPRDLWDPPYIVEQVGRDPAVLFAWTRDNTFWVPYRGLLRGPVGVLMDRLGNSLDRAVLLATLLQDAGHTVRLAHAQLSLELAVRTLPRLIARPSAQDETDNTDNGSDAAIRDLAARHHLDEPGIRQILEAGQASMARVVSEIEKGAADQTQRLSVLIDRLGVRGIGARERLDAAFDAIRDHWWVQRRDGAAWVDLDLQADAATVGRALAAAPAETVELKDVATSRAHEIVVRVVAERTQDGSAAERTLFEHTLRPADVIGTPIVLQFGPIDWPADFRPVGPDRKQAVRTTALAQHKWDATLVIGSTIAERAVFTDTSDVEDARLTSNPFGGIAGAFSNSMGLSRGRAGQALTAMWIEYETRVPGEPNRTTRRAVFDLRGPGARHSQTSPSAALSDDQKLTRSLSLMMRTEILPLVCRIAPEFLVHLLADSVIQNRTLFASAARGELNDTSAALQALASPAAPPPSPLYELAIARFDWNAAQDHVYADRPTIFSRHVSPAWRPDGIVVRDATDIVTNDIGVDLLAADAFAVRLAQGVLDTNVERLAHGPGRLVGDISQGFATSTNWKSVQSTDDPAFRDLKLSDDARGRIADDLSAGAIVVAPTAPVPLDGDAFVGWWRIDPKTGQILGIGESGWGTSATERSFLSGFAERIAKEFAFQYLLCLSMAEATAQIETWWMAGSNAPLGQAATQSWKGCSLFALISAGFFVTLPFLTTYLAVRAGLPGGIRGGFTLWLRGMRGRFPMLPLGEPSPRSFEPPLLRDEPPPSRQRNSKPCDGQDPVGVKTEGGGTSQPERIGPPGADVPNKPGMPPPSPGPSPGRPVSPEQYKQWVDYQTYGRTEAQTAYDVARQDYLAAEQANSSAQKRYTQLSGDPTTPRDALNKAFADSRGAEAALEKAQARASGTSRSLSLWQGREARALNPRVREANQQAWNAAQQLQKAEQTWQQWLKANPNSTIADPAYQQAFEDSRKWTERSAEAERELSQSMNVDQRACGGGAVGNDNPTVGANGSPQPASDDASLAPTQPALPPAQKTIVGVGGVLNALGRSK